MTKRVFHRVRNELGCTHIMDGLFSRSGYMGLPAKWYQAHAQAHVHTHAPAHAQIHTYIVKWEPPRFE